MNVTASILHYLTIKNPEIESPESTRQPSNKPHEFIPKKLQPWEEFNMATFKSMYGTRLFQEARKEGRAFHKPWVFDHERIAHDEETTKHILGQWTIFMTKAALGIVRDELHPSIWSAETRQRREEGSKPNKDRQLIPDYGAISLCQTCQERDITSYWKTRERFPKEIKPYPKFNSDGVLGRLKEGYWDVNIKNKGEDLPIRQAYTYCVKKGCRYGCILSAREAFIFRIKPLQRPDGENKDENRKAIILELKVRGLMEYVVVPWRNHRTGNVDEYEELTVNFSLWILHILAGNSHEVDWRYPGLVEEILVQQPCLPSDTGDMQATPEPQQANPILETPQTRATGIASRKRAREVEDSDGPNFSFSSEPLFRDGSAGNPSFLEDNSVTGSESADTSIGTRNFLADLGEEPPSRETLRRSTRQAAQRQRTQTPTPIRRKRSGTRHQVQN